jgi:hypothetical protein
MVYIYRPDITTCSFFVDFSDFNRGKEQRYFGPDVALTVT